MDAGVYIATKYHIKLPQRSPIEIPNTNRDTLARLLFLLQAQVGVEVGTEQGAYAEVLCQQNPGLRLFCVDAWRPYNGYRDHVGASKLEGFYEKTKARLAPYRVTLMRKFSQDAAGEFKDGSLDFVYLDAAHDFQSVTNDISAWSKKVRVGGIIAGHDYVRHHWPNKIHVLQAVNGWTDAYEIEPWFLFGRKARVDGELRDDSRSWMWVNDPKPAVRKRGRAIHQ